MKLLVSIREPKEAIIAIRGGADIIDVKDTIAGSLGAPKPSVVNETVRITKGSREVSAAIGDIKYSSSTVRLASYAMSILNLDYVKVGLEVKSYDEALDVARYAMEGLLEAGRNTKLVLVAYADYRRVGSIEPLLLHEIAAKIDAQVVMVDTRVKDETNTFNHLTEEYLALFVKKAHEYGLEAALAGRLSEEHISKAITLGFDIIGFRTAVCVRDRNGILLEDKVRSLKERMISLLR